MKVDEERSVASVRYLVNYKKLVCNPAVGSCQELIFESSREFTAGQAQVEKVV